MDCPDLTALQRAAGFVTWRNLLQLAGIALAAAGALFFASGLVRRFLRHLRLVEAALWVLGVAALAGGAFVVPEHRVWPVLFGCLVLPGAAAFSLRLRGHAFDGQRYAAALALFWGVMAVAFQQEAVGFLAVAATLAVLGLFIAVGPFCYVLGFRDRDAVLRGTLAGAAMTTTFALFAALPLGLGLLDVFRPGALWLGAFAWFLGVLITSVKYYPGGRYLARQALALSSLAGALSFGLLAGVRELVTMAAAFLLFYLAGKVIEVPLHGRIGFGLKLLAAGGLLSGMWYFSGSAGDLFAVVAP